MRKISPRILPRTRQVSSCAWMCRSPGRRARTRSTALTPASALTKIDGLLPDIFRYAAREFGGSRVEVRGAPIYPERLADVHVVRLAQSANERIEIAPRQPLNDRISRDHRMIAIICSEDITIVILRPAGVESNVGRQRMERAKGSNPCIRN